MCASYGLDPRFGDYTSLLRDGDEEIVESLRAWARGNAAATLRPTGKNLRNLNPIIRDAGQGARVEQAWWGYLVGGEPAKFPSINTRSERLIGQPGGLAGRAIVPATQWFEMQKPARRWYSFGLGDNALFGMAAVTRTGTPRGAEPVTCYSIVMRPAVGPLADIHDRMPVLIPAEFADEWLDPGATPGRGLIEAALGAGEELSARIRAEATP